MTKNVYQKTRKGIYNKTVAKVNGNKRKMDRHHYKEISTKYHNISNRSLQAIYWSIQKDNMTVPMNIVPSTDDTRSLKDKS